MGLNARQSRFVEEYVVSLNAKAAAIAAGYSERTAAEMGYENLGKPEIAEAVAAAVKARSERTGVTADRVIQELARIGFADIGQAVDWTESEVTLRPAGELSENVRAAISEVSQTKDGIKIRFHAKAAALDGLARHLGLYAAEKHEHTGRNGGPIETKELSSAERARRIAAMVAEMQAGAGQGAQATIKQGAES